MGIDGRAQIGGDAFTQPGHHIKTRGSGHRQDTGHAKQGQEGQINIGDIFLASAAKAQIDHLPERIRYGQCRTSGD